MKYPQIERLAPLLYKRGVGVLLIGKPGCAKTDFIEHRLPVIMKRALGVEEFGIHTQYLADRESSDVAGFHVPMKDADGTMITVSTKPTIIPKTTAEHGVLFLDEYLQAGLDTRKASSALFLRRMAGEFEMPGQWQTWAASNRTQDKSGAGAPLMHIINRLAVIPIEFCIDSWCRWAYENNIHPLFIGYASFQPGVISEDMPKTPEPICTPRSFSRFAELVADYCGGEVGEAIAHDPLIAELGHAMIGRAAATSALGYMKVAGEMPHWDAVLREPDVAARSIPAGRRDVVHACTSMVVNYTEPEHLDAVYQFVNLLPKEFQTATIKQLIDKLGAAKVARNASFGKWVRENPALAASSF